MKSLLALVALALGLSMTLAWQFQAAVMEPDEPVPLRTAAVPGAVAAAAWDPGTLTRIADVILKRPLFSPTRTLASVAQPRPAPPAPVPQETGARLTGVIVGPYGRLAIFDDPSGKPRSAAAGETVGSLTIQMINPGEVIVTGPDGTQVLHPSYRKPAGSPLVPGLRE